MKKRTQGWAGVARHLAQLAAGALVAAGLLTPGMEAEAAGALTSIATLAWFAIDRARDRAEEDDAGL